MLNTVDCLFVHFSIHNTNYNPPKKLYNISSKIEFSIIMVLRNAFVNELHGFWKFGYLEKEHVQTLLRTVA